MYVTLYSVKDVLQAEKILNDAGVRFTKIMAEDNFELVKSLKIMQAPALVVGN